MPDARCSQCQWWRMYEHMPTYGQCRRYPPAHQEPRLNGKINAGICPATYKNAFCGEFQEKEAANA